MPELYIGLMSGTSVDGMDSVLVEFNDDQPKLLHSVAIPMPAQLRSDILNACNQDHIEYTQLAKLDNDIARLSNNSVQQLLSETKVNPSSICAIGSHGQTIYHAPYGEGATSLQIGNPSLIAQLTGITTVADFRRRDIAAGGQGAPLVPAFHQAIFHSASENRVALNIGGMANITILPSDNSLPTTGFDTGPGNVLLDHWCHAHTDNRYDAEGKWAKSGHVQPSLLARLLADHYFEQAPPKSTGRELFNASWLQQHLEAIGNHTNADIQATLCELTATSISDAIRKYAPDSQRIIVCGGGAYNKYLLERIKALSDCTIENSGAHGIEPDWVEAVAFAWLAKQTLQQRTGNLPSVTGAKSPVVLGGIYHK